MKIVCADDNPVFQSMLRGLLATWGDQVVAAGDGEQALAAVLGDDSVRVAILDWGMPGLDGLEVCRRIRSSGQPHYVYIILLTARDKPDEFITGMEAGADDYLTKPFDPRELRMRLRAAKRVLDFEERLRVLFEEAPVAYHEIDREGIVVRINRAECALLGYTVAEVLGRPVWDFIVPELREEAQAAVRRKLQGDGAGPVFERSYLRKDGATLLLEIHENDIRGEDGRILGLRSALLDITEKRTQEKELARHADELARSNAELEQFAYVASHDLQEPLRMVSSYTQLLARRYKGKLDADADDFIHFAVDGAARMQRLITDLLALSRVRTRGEEFRPADARAALDTALLNLTAAVESSAAEVTSDPLPTVLADPVQLGQLFQNLIGNAIKFTDGKAPRIHVNAQHDGDAWLFAVRDNGIGIEAAYSERIFQVFQRLHTAKAYPGTGIGLAICRKIVERHGGRIWFTSQPGQGTTFYFTIPKLAAAA